MFDVELTRHLAELSKLAYTDEELEAMAVQMGAIVELMDTVSDFTADKDYFINEPVTFENLRKDVALESAKREEILQNAADHSDEAFRVPKVV